MKPARMSKRQARSEFSSDSVWRAAVMEWLGERCAVPGCGLSNTIQCDHLIPRSQGGLSDLFNGWPLCSVHHAEKTDGILKIDPAWLRAEHIVYLGRHDWVAWSVPNPKWPEQVSPSGRGWRHFLPMGVAL